MLTLHLAEALLSLIFILGGASTLLVPGLRETQIARLHFPLTQVAVRVNALSMIVAGFFLALGLWAQVAAWALVALLLPTTIFGHPFWLEHDLNRQAQLTHFLKNLSLLGGLLLITQFVR